jgi:hypothetical protein
MFFCSQYSSLSFSIKITIARHSTDKRVDMLYKDAKIVVILLDGLEK